MQVLMNLMRKNTSSSKLSLIEIKENTMKKFLLIVLLMFPLMNIISKADWASESTEFIQKQQEQQRQMDQAAQYQQQQAEYQQQQQAAAIVYYGAIAIDPVTRQYGATWNYQNSSEALYSAQERCAKNSNTNRCESYWSSYAYTAVAISNDDKTVQFASSGSYDDAWKKALKKCENLKSTLTECEIAIMTSNSAEPDEKRWGAIAYDPNTGNLGTSWSQYTRKEANWNAMEACNSKGCLVMASQKRYGAMAMSPDKGLYYGSSDKNMKDAEKNAIRDCKKEYKSKTCDIVGRGMAEAQANF